MCGIAGFLEFGAASRASVKDMVDRLYHRGPDQGGEYYDHDNDLRVGLGHRRLSILDLTENGNQPMASRSGRYVIVLNGEIYNHPEIRVELAGTVDYWRSRSDTETLLEAIDSWGISKALRKAVGMFAFAVWDLKERELTLARDRMGEKPLYYGWQGDSFLFASELKALEKYPTFKKQLDLDALSLYFRFGYYPSPYSAYQDIFKLSPGHCVTVKSEGPGQTALPIPYWSYLEHFDQGCVREDLRTDDEVLDELESILNTSVGGQQLSDVPLGSFLSGGVDSSLISAILQEQTNRPIKTFCIGFHERKFNEAPFAKKVADYLGTEHTELIVTPKDTLDIIPDLSSTYDEPFGDSSAIPTSLVCHLARKSVTVALSGDGGDELFGGYTHYRRDPALWSKVMSVPRPLRSLLGSGMRFVGEGLEAVGNTNASLATISARFQNLGEVFFSADVVRFFENRRSIWKDSNKLFGNHKSGVKNELFLKRYYRCNADLPQAMMAMDVMTYLSDDILTKVDRAAMSVSLETRVPFLDHRIVEFSARLPTKFKFRGNKGKWILRKLLSRHVPEELFERPKKGFAVPLDEWLRGPLKEWMLDLLDAGQLQQDGILDVKVVTNAVEKHLRGLTNNGARLWPVLNFQAWKNSH